MQQTQCTKCLGDGIVGNGDNPHMKEGHQHTCDLCGGTGKIDAQVTAAPVEETQTADVEEKKDEQTDSTGDEAESASTGDSETVQDQVENTESTSTE